MRTEEDQVDRARSMLAATAHPEEVQVSRASDALAARVAADTAFTALLLGLGGVALLVGGVGIANVMVISVLERRSEIHRSRALGATRPHITVPFLSESLILAGLGGLAGALRAALLPPTEALRAGGAGRYEEFLMTELITSDKITSITMTASEVIEQVAERTDLETETVDRVLEALAESIQEARERNEQIGLAIGSGGTHAVAALLTALLAAEQEGRLDASTASALKTLRDLVAHARRPDRLIEALMPDAIELPTPAAVLQARRNAAARMALLDEFGALSSHQVAELAGSRAANRAALANRWRAERRVVAVPVGDDLVYPGFQFTPEGRPHPVVGQALQRLHSDPPTSDWQAALWFATPTGWLGGRRPVDLLDDEPEAVVEAARREVADLAG
jgi:hypothetical protein